MSSHKFYVSVLKFMVVPHNVLLRFFLKQTIIYQPVCQHSYTMKQLTSQVLVLDHVKITLTCVSYTTMGVGLVKNLTHSHKQTLQQPYCNSVSRLLYYWTTSISINTESKFEPQKYFKKILSLFN